MSLTIPKNIPITISKTTFASQFTPKTISKTTFASQFTPKTRPSRILFLNIVGWIGWVGRSYLIAIRDEKKPTQKEIIIDAPLASSLVFRGLIWPVTAYRALLNGDLINTTV